MAGEQGSQGLRKAVLEQYQRRCILSRRIGYADEGIGTAEEDVVLVVRVKG